MTHPIIWLVTLIVACFCILFRCYGSNSKKQWLNVLRRIFGYGSVTAIVVLLTLLLNIVDHIRAPPVG